MGALERKVFSLFVIVSRIVSSGEEGCRCGRHARRPSHGLSSYRLFCQEWKYERSLADTCRSGDTATWSCDRQSFVAVILRFAGWIIAKDAARTMQWTRRSHNYIFLVQNLIDAQSVQKLNSLPFMDFDNRQRRLVFSALGRGRWEETTSLFSAGTVNACLGKSDRKENLTTHLLVEDLGISGAICPRPHISQKCAQEQRYLLCRMAMMVPYWLLSNSPPGLILN
jgi:hypothetical protein